jgi:hypothetical protein
MTKTDVSYTIIDKNGNVIQDERFNDYDKLADHMLEVADKWYNGGYDEGDQLKISSYDDTGNLVYSDVATFGETRETASEIPNEFDINVGELPGKPKPKGFGK